MSLGTDNQLGSEIDDDRPSPDRDDGTPREEPAPETTEAASDGIHRLRELDKRGRMVAALFALALLLAPTLAFAWAAPDWVPANDPALMALRSLDVGTSRTPLTGQPSTAHHQVETKREVMHPGPIHFYMMAGPIRLFGGSLGMLLVSVFITGSCVLIAAWVAFRQLGPSGGILAAVALGAITFTTGASTLVNPVSSSIAGYPLLCSAVLMWALLCGDVRLLPLSAVVLSFAAQQHLSALPALGVTVVLTLGLIGWSHRGALQDKQARARLIRWSGAAAAIAILLSLPMLIEQVTGPTGNMTEALAFSQEDDRGSQGYRRALNQVVNVLGLPPVLGEFDIDDGQGGGWFLAEPSTLTWVSAAAVVAATAVLGWRRRKNAPRAAALSAMVGVVALAGLINGSTVPDTLEALRPPFYHWFRPLIFFVVVALGLGVLRAVRGRLPDRFAWIRPLGAGVALLAIVVPAAINPSLDRYSNTLRAAYSPLTDDELDEMTDQVMAHEDELGRSTVVLDRGTDGLAAFGQALSLSLIERDVNVRFARWLDIAVHEDRLVDRDTVSSGIVVVATDGVSPSGVQMPGEPIAVVDRSGFDRAAYDDLVADFEAADEVVAGNAWDSWLDGQSANQQKLYTTWLGNLSNNYEEMLRSKATLDTLLDHPLESPNLDPDKLRRVRDSLGESEGVARRFEVYLLDRDELLAFAHADDLGDS